jgi:predicted nuclease of restriction endonuclease-like RecB superfamily
MLTAPLLRVAIKKGMIMPLFCTQNDELELAQKIVEEFQASYKARERKSELYNRLSAIELSHNDYKLVRGFYALLERRCTFNAYSYAGGGNTAPNNTTTLGAGATTTTATAVPIDPMAVRRMLFEESSKRGFALTDLERNSIIKSISEKLHVSSLDDIKRAMWSDLDDNLVFEHFDDIDAKTLVGWYNLSLMQTLLFNATKMEFHISGGTNWKRILRNVKRLGLMYYLENRSSGSQQRGDEGSENNNIGSNNNSSLVCSLEGPLSLFKLTDRYGTSLAKLLPSIVLAKEGEKNIDWQIDAWVLRKTMMQGKKLYRFKISSGEKTLLFLADPFYTNKYDDNKNGKMGKASGSPSSSSSSAFSDYSFDSLVEEKFARKFNEVVGNTSGWELVREPDPLIVAEGKAFIPDFMFEKYGNRVYLEIVGFWTPEYLERKLQKVKQIMSANNNGSSTPVVDLFIAINEELAGSRIIIPSSSSSSLSSSAATFSSSVPMDKLIFYKNDSVPIRPILDHLKALDKEMIDRKMADPNLRIEVDLSKDIIPLEDLAQKYDDLPIEVVSKIVSRDYSDQYISVGGSSGRQQYCHYYLISKAKAEKLESLLKEVKSFTDACQILSENAIPEVCHAELIEKLGYKVIWQSMDVSTAIIEKDSHRHNNLPSGKLRGIGR